MKNPASFVADYYRKKELLSPQIIDCMEYTLKTFVNELSKFILYCFIFSFLQSLVNFLLGYIVFVTVRAFAGGIHCKTYWGCFFLSLLFIGGGIYWPQLIGGNKDVLSIIALVSCIFPLLLSPVTPSFRIIKAEKNKIVLKLLAVIVSMGWIVIAYFAIDAYDAAGCILCMVSLANYQLVIPKISRITSA